MDYSVVAGPIQALLGALCAVLWASLQETKKKAEKVENDLAQYRIHVAETYASSAELKDALATINKTFEAYSSKLDVRLDRIEAKIDQKADKKEH